MTKRWIRECETKVGRGDINTGLEGASGWLQEKDGYGEPSGLPVSNTLVAYL